MSLPQLCAKNMTGGFNYLPICMPCVDSEKKVKKYGKKKTRQERKEKEAIARDANGN